MGKYVYGEEKECVICERTFRPRDKVSAQKCCSYACRGALQTRKAIRACETCGKDFMPSRPQYKTCSRKCGAAYKASRKVPDPMVPIRGKLARFCCGQIARCLRNKTDRTKNLLGYTVEELRQHLEKYFEPSMSWGNYGRRLDQWSIDHTKPLTAFPAAAPLREINALENLRPMWHQMNCSKKNKWEER